MKPSQSRAAASVVSTALVSTAFTSGVWAAFERIPTGPGDAGSGEIVALSEDPVFGNPATRGAVSMNTEAWGGHPFGLGEVREMQFSTWLALHRVGIGVGVRELGAPDYFEREARLSISLSPARRAPKGEHSWAAPSVGVGFAPRILFVGGTSFTMRTAFAGDLALRARLDESTELGLILESLAGGAPGDPEHRLPRSSLGISRRFHAHTQGLLEVSRRADRAPRVAAGLVVEPHTLLTLRAGARADPPSIAWGFTVRALSFLVSFSSTQTDHLGRTIRVGVGWMPRIAQDATGPADP